MKEGKTRFVERSQDETGESPDDMFGFKPKPNGGSFPALEDHVLPPKSYNTNFSLLSSR